MIGAIEAELARLEAIEQAQIRVIVAQGEERKRLEADLAEAVKALEKIASGWKYPPASGMRPPPEPLGMDGMKRLAQETLSRLQTKPAVEVKE